MDADKRIRRFKRVRIKLMRSPMFMSVAPIMMLGKTEVVDDIPTACTDGRDEKYGTAFIDGLSDEELAFVIMHENFGHKMCRHLVLYKNLHKEDPQLANMACDYWINNKLIKLDPAQTLVAMPRDKDGKMVGLYEPKYDGLDVPAIFRLLKQKQDEEGGGQGGGGDGDGDGDGFDSHDWDGASGMSEEEQEELRKDVEQAIRQGEAAAKAAGYGSQAAKLGLGELLAPKVDWRKQLAEFVRATCRKPQVSTWRRPNRRYLTQDMIMPSLQGKSIKELVMAPDASGSMLGKPFTKCMSEVASLVKQLGIDKLHIIYWDGAVCGHETYTAATLNDWRSKTRPRGGGGTDPTCVVRYMQEKKLKPDAVVVLTDGELTGWGTWSVPVLWAITNVRKITAPTGKTIRMED